MPDSGSSVLFGRNLIESEESINIKKPIIIVIVISEELVNFIIISFVDSHQAGTRELMGLLLVHLALSRVAVEDDLEASNHPWIQLIIHNDIRLIIGGGIAAADSQGFIEVYGELLYGSWVIVFRDLSLLAQLDLLNFVVELFCEGFLQLIEGGV